MMLMKQKQILHIKHGNIISGTYNSWIPQNDTYMTFKYAKQIVQVAIY